MMIVPANAGEPTPIDRSHIATKNGTPTKMDDDLELYLCIDGGGTKTNVSIAARRSKQGSERDKSEAVILARGSHRSSNYTDVGLESAIVSIGEATIQALQSLPDQSILKNAREWNYEGFRPNGSALKPAPFSRIWAGLSGVDSDQDRLIIREGLIKLFGLSNLSIQLGSIQGKEKHDKDTLISRRLKITNDCDLLSSSIETHYQSNKNSTKKPCKGGIVLIAGTGSIATAFGPAQDYDDQINCEPLVALGRLGGYGYLLGDEGSAYDVGRQTIKEVLKFSDQQQQRKHRDQSSNMQLPFEKEMDEIEKSDIVHFLLNQFEIDRLDNLLGSVYSIKDEHERKIRIAEVSRFVMGCAFRDQPDRFAMRVMENAAKRLSELVLELSQLYDLNPEEMVLCLGGGMWAYTQFKELLINTMKTDWNADWGWIETIDQPDQVAVLSLTQ